MISQDFLEYHNFVILEKANQLISVSLKSLLTWILNPLKLTLDLQIIKHKWTINFQWPLPLRLEFYKFKCLFIVTWLLQAPHIFLGMDQFEWFVTLLYFWCVLPLTRSSQTWSLESHHSQIFHVYSSLFFLPWYHRSEK